LNLSFLAHASAAGINAVSDALDTAHAAASINQTNDQGYLDPHGTSILIAATRCGVCWIGIHQSTAYLESELRSDFPKAAIVRDESVSRDSADQIIGFVQRKTCELELPVDISATPFQLSVWRELCAIPAGATRSYGEIARRLGRPAASRAVGRANGSNPLAVLIPCHRAVGTGGRLTGYRWGVEYKRYLLQHEAAGRE
jgi:AraC family transcriptional regulator of adaptative response/methylated-DNA-[protein]-cysteine methyltransferase